MMTAVKAYFDGNAVRTFGRLEARRGQMLSITVLDEFLSDEAARIAEEMCGILHSYADSAKIPLEKTAWEEAAEEKHGGK